MLNLFRLIPRMSRVNEHMTEVVRGASVAFVLKVLGTGFGFLINIVLARLLGAEGIGIYYLALTLVTISTVIGRLGLDNSLIRFTASEGEQENWDKVKGLYQQGMGLATGCSILATLGITVLAPWMAQDLFKQSALTMPLRLMSLGILPMSLLTLHASMLQGLKQIREAMFVQGLAVPLLNLSLVILLSGRLGILGAVTAYVISTVLVLILAAILWRRAVPDMSRFMASFDTRQLLATSMPLLGVGLMNLVLDSTAIIMLGMWETDEAVGIFGTSTRTAMLTSFIIISVNSIVAPKFAVLHMQQDYTALNRIARESARLMTLVSLPIVLLFLIRPGWVLQLFGSDFMGGESILQILAIGQFVNVAVGSVGYLLIMTGYEKLVSWNIAFHTVANILLNVLLIPEYGTTGAAIATSLTVISKNIVSLWLVRHYLSIKIII